MVAAGRLLLWLWPMTRCGGRCCGAGAGGTAGQDTGGVRRIRDDIGTRVRGCSPDSCPPGDDSGQAVRLYATGAAVWRLRRREAAVASPAVRLAALDWGGWATRFVFFTGKGGVGKTTIAAASAVRLADAGQRIDRKSTRLNSSHYSRSRMPSSA